MTFVRRLQRTVVCLVTVLIAVMLVWLFAGGVSLGRAVVAAVLAAPLLLALAGLVAGNRRTYAWTTLAVVPCFVFAMTELIANPPARLWAGTCLFVGFAVFVGAIGYLRVTK